MLLFSYFSASNPIFAMAMVDGMGWMEEFCFAFTLSKEQYQPIIQSKS